MVSEGAAFPSIALNRKTFSGTRKIDRPVPLRLPNTAPMNPNGGRKEQEEAQGYPSEKKEERAKQHAQNLEAAGLPTDYQHDNNIGKQHPKAQLLRKCLADNLRKPIRSFNSGQQGTEACPFCNATKGTARYVY